MDLDHIVLTFSSEQSPYDEFAPLQAWSVEAVLVDLTDDSDDGIRTPVGSMQLVTVPYTAIAASAADLLDGMSGDLEVIGSTIFDVAEGGLAEEYAEAIEHQLGSDILIVDRVELEKGFRGQGLG